MILSFRGTSQSTWYVVAAFSFTPLTLQLSHLVMRATLAEQVHVLCPRLLQHRVALLPIALPQRLSLLRRQGGGARLEAGW